MGGHSTILPGGRIRGDVFQFGSLWPLPEGRAAVAVIAALVALRGVLAWLVVTFAALLSRRDRIAAVAQEARADPIRTFLVGLLAALAVGAASLRRIGGLLRAPHSVDEVDRRERE